MSETQSTGVTLSSNTYDKAKFVVQIVLPALGVLYASLAQFWGFPRVEEIVGSITALALFLGVVLRLSSKNYTPEGAPIGQFTVVDQGDGKKTVRLDLDHDPEEFIGNDVISFHLNKETEVPAEPVDPEENRDENLS